MLRLWELMNIKDRIAAAQQLVILQGEVLRRSSYKIAGYFLDTGPLRRSLYRGATEFFAGGLRYPERLLLGGNRVGKTDAAACEVTYHSTGIYPRWWKGRRFKTPVDIWCAGDTAATTRDIQQLILYGTVPSARRTGMLPAHLILSETSKNSVPGAIETLSIRHVTGGISTIQFKSYDQKREAFQGTAKHVVWLDEECPEDIYTESLMRTLTCAGLMIVTFTPIEGLTPFVQNWLETGVLIDEGQPVSAAAKVFSPTDSEVIHEGEEVTEELNSLPVESRQRLITMISWDEVPHLSDAAKQQMLTSIPPYQRNARTRGIPNLGSGVIYPIPEDEIKVRPFAIPDHWPRGFGMDVGWNWTTAIHGAFDRETQTWYFYKEHYRSHAEPPVHAQGIQSAGAWIPGRIDPAANGRTQVDGRQLIEVYKGLGLDIENADNGVEAGITTMWNLLTTGKLKVFSSLRNFFTEYRMYRRNAKGQIVKKNDHLMDAGRYLVHSGVEWLRTGPSQDDGKGGRREYSEHANLSWMG